jgi:hypothetical protein
VKDHLVDKGFASAEDLSLFEVAASADEAILTIERFYANYHSARYVGERLVLRLQRAPSKERLARLNERFGDIVTRGHIEGIGVTPEERRDGDCVDLARIAMHPGHNFGRIRQLIDALNAPE